MIANFSKSFMVFVAASTLGRSHLVFIDPYFIPPTHPTNVACLHHGLVYGRLAVPSRSTLYDQQDSNLGCPEAIVWGGMKSGVSLLSIPMVPSALWAGAL